MKRLIALFCLAVAMAGPAFAAIAVGDIPPDYLGRNPGGDEVRVSDQRGKVVVITFWASWCGYCRKELPVLAGLQDVAGKDRVEVIAVNYEDDRDVYRALRRKLKNVQLTMTHDQSGEIGRAYGVQGIPRLFMIDRQGRVAYIHSGYGDSSIDEIVKAVNKLLATPT
ncbi:MAG TPA: TlpA disulfide reductase family protein [Luteimonas sp.]